MKGINTAKPANRANIHLSPSFIRVGLTLSDQWQPCAKGWYGEMPVFPDYLYR